MSRLAGSAIAQGPNVGRIDRWSKWKPTDESTLWLLLSGASNPPENIEISKRRPRDSPGDINGAFLAGVSRDFANMQELIIPKIYNIVRDFYFTRDKALEHITNFFQKCMDTKARPMLYYTGHGEIGTGNWCFADGTISIQEIFDMLPGGLYYPMIFSDACYSGHWANFCLEKGISGFHCLAACPEYSTAFDTKGEGGDLTLFMTGKKERPLKEPMYSGGNLLDFPITSGFDLISYSKFLKSFIKNSQRVVSSQSIHNGFLSAYFVTSKLHDPRPAVDWQIFTDLKKFSAFVREQRKKSMMIYSLAFDEGSSFGVFLLKNYGTDQRVLKRVSSIRKYREKGFKITACAAQGKPFCVIMTEDAENYKGKIQTWFTSQEWRHAEKKIKKGYQAGKIITGICYSHILKKYLVVITQTQQKQCYFWQVDNTSKEQRKREKIVREREKEGFYPSVIFTDPNNGQTLFVMTKDESIQSCICKVNYKMEG